MYALDFYPRDVVSAVLATATWLAGWSSVGVCAWVVGSGGARTGGAMVGYGGESRNN